jgi:hypothetical protein
MGYGKGIIDKEVEERCQLPDHMALGMIGWAAVHILFSIKTGVLQKNDLPRPERFYGVLGMRAEYIVDVRHIPAQKPGQDPGMSLESGVILLSRPALMGYDGHPTVLQSAKRLQVALDALVIQYISAGVHGGVEVHP